MSERFKRQISNDLEIRGISRGSLSNHPKPDSAMAALSQNTRSSLFYRSMFSHPDADSDYEDDSTLTGGSQVADSPSYEMDEDTITTGCGASNFWSAANSYTTGNTTERSSLYSWGDDEFDHQTSTVVREMFMAIEQMLFEGILSGSSSLQQECRQWMSSFPHLRIIGKQVMSSSDEGFQFIPTMNNMATNSSSSSEYFLPDQLNTESIRIRGSSIKTQLYPATTTSSNFNLQPQQHEELIDEDGVVEELIAYNFTEIEDEEKRYHVPHRRKLGFPPITPNACVRDTVLHQLFDVVWSKVISALCNTNGNYHSLLECLVKRMWSSSNDGSDAEMENQTMHHHHHHHHHHPQNRLVSSEYTQHNFEGTNASRGLHTSSSSFLIHSNHTLTLPPSCGGYFDHMSGDFGQQFSSYMPKRSPTAPTSQQSGSLFSNITDNSLNGLMTISQKKLQTRHEKNNQIDEMTSSSHEDDMRKLQIRPSTMSGHLDEISSTFYPTLPPRQSRDVISRDVMSSSSLLSHGGRQMTAGGGRRRGIARSVGRLQPLDNKRTKSLKPQHFNGFVRATKLTRPSDELHQHPPWTANNLPTNLWVNNRLPPINNLQSLNEESALDLKKSRGKTAYTRISSAYVDDKSEQHRILGNFSRPNTTHTFRADNSNLFHKRSTSVLLPPTHLSFGAQGHAINGVKSNPHLSMAVHSSTRYNNSNNITANNHTSLSGITGVGILGSNQILSPLDGVVSPQWGRSSNI